MVRAGRNALHSRSLERIARRKNSVMNRLDLLTSPDFEKWNCWNTTWLSIPMRSVRVGTLASSISVFRKRAVAMPKPKSSSIFAAVDTDYVLYQVL